MHAYSIARTIGAFSIIFGITLLVPIVLTIGYAEPDELINFFIPFVGSVSLGGALWLIGRREPANLGTRDGFLIVALFWLIISILGAWPLMMSTELKPLDALFEAVSGVTTTGATVMTGLDGLPKSVLFYRQQLQWLGGMGLIVLGVAVMPMLGIGGMQLYRAEVPGPSKEEKLTPRLAQTARALWLLYFALTVACALGYWLAGMDLFDAVAHSLSTVSTGGFSTHDASIGYYDSSLIEWVAVLFMLLAAINFGVHFSVWHNRTPLHYWRDPEARTFLKFVVAVVLVVSTVLLFEGEYSHLTHSVQDAAFEVVSLVTSTGFAKVDFSHWPDFLPLLLIYISFVGGCGGSTAGGMKVMRVMLLIQQGLQQVRSLIHPHALIPVRMGKRTVDARLMQSIWGFFGLYMATFALLVLMMIHAGLDERSAFAAIATCMNNLGPGLGEVAYTFQSVSDMGKSLSILAMLLGRLEIFTLLVLLSPGFWLR
ncbi:MAG: TrkH family potassium uptake protein [Candidatus Thiodiazotropha sp.]|jgi:trk system potassium uptake protein TrkH